MLPAKRGGTARSSFVTPRLTIITSFGAHTDCATLKKPHGFLIRAVDATEALALLGRLTLDQPLRRAGASWCSDAYLALLDGRGGTLTCDTPSAVPIA